MKLGLMIGSEHTSLRSGVELARSAEQAGFESLWMPEFWRSYSVPVAAVAEFPVLSPLWSDGCFGTVRTGWMAQFRAPKRPKRPRFGPLKCR